MKKVIFLILLLLMVLVNYSSEVAPQKLGFYIVNVGDFNSQQKTFSSTFWLFQHSKESDYDILSYYEMPNAVTTKVLNRVVIPEDKGYLIQEKIYGIFRHNWDTREFPFDKQNLNIIFEAPYDTSSYQFEIDSKNSTYDKDIELSGWEIVGLSTLISDKTYQSNFGDERISGSSTYSRFEIDVRIQRTEITGFWKLTIASLVAVCLVFVTFFITFKNSAALGIRTGVQAAAAFGTIVSMRSASADLGASSNITLIDSVHILVLLYIVLGMVTSVICWKVSYCEDTINIEKADELSRKIGILGLIVFIVLIGILVLFSIV